MNVDLLIQAMFNEDDIKQIDKDSKEYPEQFLKHASKKDIANAKVIAKESGKSLNEILEANYKLITLSKTFPSLFKDSRY